MRSLASRVLAHELMDSPDLPAHEVAHALRGLATLNRMSLAASSVWRRIAPLVQRGERVSLLDIATGSADVPIAVARHGARHGVSIELALCDLRPEMREIAARNAAAAGVRARTFAFDALRDRIDGEFDLVTASLFTHHLSDDAVVKLLRVMRDCARRAVIVNDLERGAFNLVAATCGAHAATRSRVVHVDAPLSVRAAFTRAEFAALAERAGLSGGRTHGAFPCRFVYVWERGA